MLPARPIRLNEYKYSKRSRLWRSPACVRSRFAPVVPATEEPSRCSGQREPVAPERGGLNRFRGSGTFELNNQHTMGEKPDSRKNRQTDAEWAMRQSHPPIFPALIRFTPEAVESLDHQCSSTVPRFHRCGPFPTSGLDGAE